MKKLLSLLLLVFSLTLVSCNQVNDFLIEYFNVSLEEIFQLPGMSEPSSETPVPPTSNNSDSYISVYQTSWTLYSVTNADGTSTTFEDMNQETFPIYFYFSDSSSGTAILYYYDESNGYVSNSCTISYTQSGQYVYVTADDNYVFYLIMDSNSYLYLYWYDSITFIFSM
jgi:hypothetical protein